MSQQQVKRSFADMWKGKKEEVKVKEVREETGVEKTILTTQALLESIPPPSAPTDTIPEEVFELPEGFKDDPLLSFVPRKSSSYRKEEQEQREEENSGISVLRKFTTGAAGSGKTYEMMEMMRNHPSSILMMATTGIAAVNLGGGITTVHSKLGFYDIDSLETSYIRGKLHNKLVKIFKLYDAIGIDEGSMLHARQLEIINDAIQDVSGYSQFRNRKQGFGLRVVGDFCQLPPVPDKDKVSKKNLPVRFAFDAECWDKFEIEKKEKIWRQDDPLFLKAVNYIRRGEGNDGAYTLRDAGAEFVNNVDMGYNGTTLYAINDQVDRHNASKLQQIKGEMIRSVPKYWGKLLGEWDSNKRGCQIPFELRLKVGAYVMILSNDTETWQYANGDTGWIEGYNEVGDFFTIRLKRNDRVVILPRVTRYNMIEDEGDAGYINPDCYYDEKRERWIVGSIQYHPLRLAYAATVHKTQGLTLEGLQIDISHHFFGSPAMAYVAISRAKSAKGLRIVGNVGFLAKRVQIDERVRGWV